MSMKIHDGHQLQLDTPNTVLDFFDTARTKLTDRFSTVRDALLVGMASAYLKFPERVPSAVERHLELDEVARVGNPSALRLAQRDMLLAQRSPYRTPLDLGVHLTIATDATRPETHALVRVFGSTRLYEGVLDELRDDPYNGFSEYAYQNSTDRPDNISQAAWDRRRASWDATFGWEATSKSSLCWSLIEDAPTDTINLSLGGRWFYRHHMDELTALWNRVAAEAEDNPYSFEDAIAEIETGDKA